MSLLIGLLVVVPALLHGEPTESRGWKAKSGHTVEGRILSIEDGQAELERADGRKVRVPLDKFADEDQALLRGHFGVKSPEPGAGPEFTPADDLPHPLGQTTGEIDAGGGWSYFLHLPKSLAKGGKHPVMFIMSPGGGGPDACKRYIPGAERNRFILAVSKQSKNGFDGSQKAIDAMIQHITETLPVDEDRLYTTGFSGGSRMALQTAAQNDGIAGVLACGAGGGVGSGKQVVYGLCGTNCFNRTDMAHGFKGYRNRDGLLRYFPGQHAWAGDELIEDGMCHLNGVFLLSNARAYPEATARYVHDMMTLIRGCQDNDPMRAYMWTSFLTGRDAEAPDLATIHAGLGASPTNKLYVEGLARIEDFAEDTLGDISASQWKIDPKVSSAFARESKKYAGTPWEDILMKMSEDAQKF
jgi:dienelactone hydrolase